LGKRLAYNLGNLIGKLPIISRMSDDGETTVLTPATTLSKSLRTTIPAGIVRQFSLADGDKIRWKMEVIEGELVIVARPLKKQKGSR
jgi:hypothetical protein